MAEATETPMQLPEDDEISINTSAVDNPVITNTGEEKEYVVKFLFRPKSNATNTAVAKTHYAILQAIREFFPETKVFDNYGMEMKKFSSMKSYDEYLRYFKLQFVKANEQKCHESIYLC